MQTDNSELATKVALRIDHIPTGAVRVLDAYGGHGVVWGEVSAKTGRHDIIRTGVDVHDRPGCVKCDNRKVLAGLHAGSFDVIDLDAYGVPFAQMRLVLDSDWTGGVFFTFIQVGMRQVPMGLVLATGGTKEQFRQTPTLFGKLGWELWLEWLCLRGVDLVWHRSIERSGANKHYGYFVKNAP